MYDPTTARFTAVDPLAEKYFDLSPYNYVANNPIRFIDIKGDSITNPAARTQVGLGIVGVIGSGAYMVYTGGLGAVAGGSVSMGFSFGELALGIKELANKDPNYSTPGTLPGAIVESQGGTEELIATADALGGLIPGAVTGGNLMGTIENAGQLLKAKSVGEGVYYSASVYDGVADINAAAALIILSNEMVDNPNRKKDYGQLNKSSGVSTITRLLTSTGSNQSYTDQRGSNKDIADIKKFIKSL